MAKHIQVGDLVVLKKSVLKKAESVIKGGDYILLKFKGSKSPMYIRGLSPTALTDVYESITEFLTKDK